jgi:hypothetical protein
MQLRCARAIPPTRPGPDWVATASLGPECLRGRHQSTMHQQFSFYHWLKEEQVAEFRRRGF